jgi:hypothetical protein
MKRDLLHLRHIADSRDERGSSNSLSDAARMLGVPLKDLHLMTLRPTYVLGNHFHTEKREQFLWYTRTRGRSTGIPAQTRRSTTIAPSAGAERCSSAWNRSPPSPFATMELLTYGSLPGLIVSSMQNDLICIAER